MPKYVASHPRGMYACYSLRIKTRYSLVVTRVGRGMEMLMSLKIFKFPLLLLILSHVGTCVNRGYISVWSRSWFRNCCFSEL